MGAFFGNIQIYNSDKQSPQAVLERLKEVLKGQGYTVAANADDADAVLAACPSPDSLWTGIYTSWLDEQNIRRLEQDTCEFAKALETYCVGVDVFDSDFLFLILHDAVHNKHDKVAVGNAEALAETGGIDKTAWRGNAADWQPLLGDGAEPAALQAAWEQEPVFAEDALAEVCALTGMCIETAGVGYGYLDKNAALQKHYLYLKACRKTYKHADGPPRMVPITDGGTLFVTGEPNSLAFCNVGGAAKGLAVAVSGNFTSYDQVEIADLTLVKRKNPAGPRPKDDTGYDIQCCPMSETKFEDGRLGLYAMFGDFEIPAGIDLEDVPPWEGLEAQVAHAVQVYLTVQPKSTVSHLEIYLIPLENQSEGQACVPCGVYDPAKD